MYKVLSQEQIDAFEREGALFPVPVLSADEVMRFRTAFEELETYYDGPLKRLDYSHLFFRWAYDLAMNPAVLDMMEDLLGPYIFIHSTRVFCKPPHDPAFVTWHQDGRYSGLNSKPAPSVWIALTESTVESGCVRVIPRSHTKGVFDHTEGHGVRYNLLNAAEQVAIRVDEAQAMDLVLHPGELSIHHVNLIHGSNPNRSDTKRLGFAISYVTPAAGPSILPAVRARGRTDDHPFELMQEPPSLPLEEAVGAHAAFIRERGLSEVKVALPS